MDPPAAWPDTLEAWCTSFEREDLEKEARRQQLQRARCGGGPSAAWLRHEAAERRVFLRLGERRCCDDSGGGELADSELAAGGSDAGSSAWVAEEDVDDYGMPDDWGDDVGGGGSETSGGGW